MVVRFAGGEAAAGGAFEETELEEIGFVDVGDRCFFFRGRRGDGAEADRPAGELFDENFQNSPVGGREAELVNAEHV